MQLPEGFHITTAILLRGMLLFGIPDLILLVGLACLVRPDRFGRLGRILPAVTAVAWLSLWLWAVTFGWEAVYAYIFPTWMRWWLPPYQALLTAGVAWLAFQAARVWMRAPVVAYCLLGGVWGILSHILAVFLGIVSKPPALQGASPIAAIAFAFFEFTLYFCVIVLVSTMLQILLERIYLRQPALPDK